MLAVTYFAAMPFLKDDAGELVAGAAQERQSATLAENAARRSAKAAAGAVSRSGDPATGEFDDGVVLRTLGDVPVLDDVLEP